MARMHWVVILAMAVFSACSTAPKVSEQTTLKAPELTDAQIKRYLISYPAARRMASRYWGARRYSPPNEMLPSEGTFDRAYAEMEAAGAMPDFELLLQNYGYNDPGSWMQLNARIAYAYGMLRLRERNPAHAEKMTAERVRQREFLAAERAKLEDMPEGKRVEQLKSLNRSERELDRYLLAERDADAIRPFASEIEKVNR